MNERIMELFSSKPAELTPKQELELKKANEEARKNAERVARFEYDAIVRKALRIKSTERRIELLALSIEEVKNELAERKMIYAQESADGNVEDPESTLRYFDSLRLTARKLKAFLRRERFSLPSLTDSEEPVLLKSFSSASLKEKEKEDSAKEPTGTGEYMDINEVAKLTKLSKSTIYKKTQKGTIPCHKPSGHKLIFIRSEIMAWITKPKEKSISEAVKSSGVKASKAKSGAGAASSDRRDAPRTKPTK
ncbi:MAG: helix-turn-helix domain-containing protein [Spirochaetia bacterium]